MTTKPRPQRWSAITTPIPTRTTFHRQPLLLQPPPQTHGHPVLPSGHGALAETFSPLTLKPRRESRLEYRAHAPTHPLTTTAILLYNTSPADTATYTWTSAASPPPTHNFTLTKKRTAMDYLCQENTSTSTFRNIPEYNRITIAIPQMTYSHPLSQPW